MCNWFRNCIKMDSVQKKSGVEYLLAEKRRDFPKYKIKDISILS